MVYEAQSRAAQERSREWSWLSTHMDQVTEWAFVKVCKDDVGSLVRVCREADVGRASQLLKSRIWGLGH